MTSSSIRVIMFLERIDMSLDSKTIIELSWFVCLSMCGILITYSMIVVLEKICDMWVESEFINSLTSKRKRDIIDIVIDILQLREKKGE